MSMKVYVNVELDGYGKQKSKLPLPKSWVSTKEVRDVIDLFVKSYNAKQVDTPLDADNIHLETQEGVKICSNHIVDQALEDHVDYFIHIGQHLAEVAKEEVIDPNMVRCKNYGCNQYYLEEDNAEGSCVHHTGPPIFHDTMKCWSCCQERKAFDFESFQLIAGCSTGKHSSVSKSISIAPSPNATAPAGEGASGDSAVLTAPLKSISDYNKANPEAASSEAAAAKATVRKCTRDADGINAKCQRQGCQKKFLVENKRTEVCTYHKGNAVFHDALKFWSCCPDKKFMEFDDFLKYPGCCTGLHDDGVDE